MKRKIFIIIIITLIIIGAILLYYNSHTLPLEYGWKEIPVKCLTRNC